MSELVTVPVKVIAKRVDNTRVAGARVRCSLTVADVDGQLVVPHLYTGTTDAEGELTLNLWPNVRGVNGSQYRVEITGDGVNFSGVATVPDSSCDLHAILALQPPAAVNDAQAAALSAQAAAARTAALPAALVFTFDAGTADAAPGAGKLRFNHADLASATAAYIDVTEAGGASIAAVLDFLDDSTNLPTRAVLAFKEGATGKLAFFRLMGAVVDGGGYRKLQLAYLDGAAGSFTAGNPVGFSFSLMSAAAAAGANRQIQFNDGGVLSGAAGFTWDKATNTLTLPDNLLVGQNDTSGSNSGVIVGKTTTPSAANHLTIYSLYTTNPSHKLWQSAEGAYHDYMGRLNFRDTLTSNKHHAFIEDKIFALFEDRPDPLNYSRGFMRFASNQLQIGAEAAGTGTVRPIYFVSNGSFNFRTSTDAIPKYVIGPARVDLYATNDGANYERFATVWEAAELRLKVEAGGTGTMRNASVWTNTNFYWRSSGGVAQMVLAGGASANMQLSLRPTGTGLYSIIDMLGLNGTGVGATLQAGQGNLWVGADTHTFRSKDSSQNYLVLNTTVATFTTPVRSMPVPFANLPTPAGAGSGARAFITDSDKVAFGNFGAAAAGGGGTLVPVYSDGAAWRIG